MYKFFFAGLLFLSSSLAISSWAADSEVVDKKSQRIELLQERLEVLDQAVDAGRISADSKIQPNIDLLEVKIEYAASEAEKRTLYKELLEQYDLLIAAIQFQLENPNPEKDLMQSSLNHSRLLKLKADRVANEIRLDELSR